MGGEVGGLQTGALGTVESSRGLRKGTHKVEAADQLMNTLYLCGDYNPRGQQHV